MPSGRVILDILYLFLKYSKHCDSETFVNIVQLKIGIYIVSYRIPIYYFCFVLGVDLDHRYASER